MRMVTGKTSAEQALKWIYRDLGSVKDVRNSLRLTMLAACIKFDLDPKEFLQEELDLAPGPERWAELKPQLENTILGITEEETTNGNGSH